MIFKFSDRFCLKILRGIKEDLDINFCKYICLYIVGMGREWEGERENY